MATSAVVIKSLNADTEDGLEMPLHSSLGVGDGSGAPVHALKRHVTAFWVTLLVMLATNLGLLLGSLEYLGNTGVLVQTDFDQYTRLTIASVLVFAGLILGSGSILLLFTFAVRSAQDIGRPLATAAVFLTTVGCIVGVGISGHTLMQPDRFYYALMPIDYNRQYLGGVLIVVYSLLAAAGMCISAMMLCARPTPRHAPLAFKQPQQPHGWRYGAWRVVLLFLLYGVVWFLSTILPCIWNGTDGAASLSGYFQTQSSYSLITTMWTFSVPAAPSSLDALFWWNGQLYLKLFPDVCVYFSGVLGVALLAFIGTLTPSVRRWLHVRVRGPPTSFLPAWLRYYVDLWDLGVSVGELLVTAGVIALYGYWLWYWSTGYPRISQITTEWNDQYPALQNWARVMGHIANLSMSLMILPAARNSVWESVFGIGFERLVKYHRVLGRLTWASVTIHMVLWYVKWLQEGNLVNNLTTVNNLVVTTGIVHNDNFTIIIVETAWLLLTISLVFASVMRRRNYELFKYTHYFAYFFFLAALYHAWNLWYYLVPGLFLYAVDKIIRAIKSSRSVNVVSLTHSAGITRVAVDADIFKHGFFAGQYAFINIPSVSLLQWHPFTISSAPTAAYQDKVVTFHIKDMGPGTWTNSLAALAVSAPFAQDVQIGIDGPYGRAGYYYERDTVVLVAGGIGVTPIHAILQDLYARLADPSMFGDASVVRKVVLVWIVRDQSILPYFADTLASAIRHKQGTFEVHVHVTGTGLNGHHAVPADAGACEPSSLSTLTSSLTRGRPDLRAILDNAVTDAVAHHRTSGGAEGATARDLVSVFVCGPSPLIAEVSEAAFRHGADFHSEVFHF